MKHGDLCRRVVPLCCSRMVCVPDRAVLHQLMRDYTWVWSFYLMIVVQCLSWICHLSASSSARVNKKHFEISNFTKVVPQTFSVVSWEKQGLNCPTRSDWSEDSAPGSYKPFSLRLLQLMSSSVSNYQQTLNSAVPSLQPAGLQMLAEQPSQEKWNGKGTNISDGIQSILMNM